MAQQRVHCSQKNHYVLTVSTHFDHFKFYSCLKQSSALYIKENESKITDEQDMFAFPSQCSSSGTAANIGVS